MKPRRPPTAPVLPTAMIGISARPAGSSQFKLYDDPRGRKGRCQIVWGTAIADWIDRTARSRRIGVRGIKGGDLVDYRNDFRPLLRGLGGEAPLRGFLKNSDSGTSSVAANRSNTSTVGFPTCRSRPPVDLSIISEALLREAALDPKSLQIPGHQCSPIHALRRALWSLLNHRL